MVLKDKIRFSLALSQKIEKMQERTLRLLYNDSYSSNNSLLLKAERPTMKVSRLRRLAIKVLMTLNSLNSDFMHIYFKKGSHSARRRNDLVVNRAKSTTFVENLEFSTWRRQRLNFSSIIYIKTWYGPECKCNICKYSGNPYHYTWTSHPSLNMS